MLLADWRPNRGRLHVQIILCLFRLAQALRGSRKARPLSVIASGLYRCISLNVGLDVPTSTSIGAPLIIHHTAGVVIHNQAILGAGVELRQGVTIGSRSRGGGAPRIGDGVQFGASALALGPIVVGEKAIVGAGAVLLSSIPAGAVAVGNPARYRSPDASS